MQVTGNWLSTNLKDMRGNEIKVGDKVARAYVSGRSANLEVRDVREIKGGKLYLSDSKVPIQYPGRLLIVTELYTS